jgi:hypothetical protein
MPLLDHFRPPVMGELPGDTLHSSWASDIARSLNVKWLMKPFRALEHRHVGPSGEVDVGTFETPGSGAPTSPNGGPVATMTRSWAPPKPVCSEPLVFPDAFEVRVYAGPSGWTLVGAIELVSESNKDRAKERSAFVTKCASYLHAGVSVVIMDVITSHQFNLHNQLLDLLGISGEARLPEDVFLYAASYRPLRRGDRGEVEVWHEPCRPGAVLPTMPLRLTGDLFVPIEFEATYQETCRTHWL